MPYRRPYRKFYRRRGVTRMYRKKFTKRGNSVGDKGKRLFKVRLILSADANVGGIITLGATNNPSSAQDWSAISTLFDVYKVCAMQVKYIPSLPNDTSTVTGYAPLYVIADSDTATSPLTSVNDAIQYENMKPKNMFRPWKYYYKFQKRTAVSGGPTMLVGGYQDIASTTASGGIYAWGSGFDVSTTYGTYIVTYYIAAKNRR